MSSYWPSLGKYVEGLDKAGKLIRVTTPINKDTELHPLVRLQFRGLHYYDGHLGALEMSERIAVAHAGYERLLKVVKASERNGMGVAEVITAGTPTLPCSLTFEGFRGGGFLHRVSPGTVVYCDATSLSQLPSEYGYRPAILVLTRVVSRPRAGIGRRDQEARVDRDRRQIRL